MEDTTRETGTAAARPAARVELYWIPLGAGGSVLVRLSGRLFERVTAWRERRRPQQLYHAALVIEREGTRWAIEMAPAWQLTDERGVVASGPVGLRLLGRSRWFRYEVRRWPDGAIPDLAFARGGPDLLDTDDRRAAELLAALADVPRLTWGRDELRAGEMWNSNSLVSWALVRSGHAVDGHVPPERGVAPGWRAGLALATRDLTARNLTARDLTARDLTAPSATPTPRASRLGRRHARPRPGSRRSRRAADPVG